MNLRRCNRLLVIVVVLAMTLPAWGTATARQATPAASPAGEDVITGQRLNAVPLGEIGQVGDIDVVVTGFNQDASAMLNPEGSYQPPANRTIVNIALSLTNNGSEPIDASAIAWLTAGNRGLLLYPPSTAVCTVDGNVLRTETLIVAPGETAAGNYCTAVLTEDVASLQLFAVESATLFGSGVDAIPVGTWFNIGAPDGYAPSNGEAAAAARDGAVQGSREAPANASDTVLVGSLAVTQVEYIPNATAEMLAFDPMASVSDGIDTAYAAFDLVNVGTAAAAAGISLFDGSGIGLDSAAFPSGFREVTGTGYVLPGGSTRIHGAWQGSPETASERAFRIASGIEASWLLAADGNAVSLNLSPVELAEPASADAADPVPYGQNASVAGVNLTLSPGTSYSHTLTLAVANAQPNGDSIWLTLSFGEDWTETCDFVREYGSTTSFSGSFNRIVLPGAHQTFDINCDDGGTTPLTVSVELGNEELVGYFARSGEVQAQPADQSADAGDTEPAADQPADTAPAGGEPATVIAATANVRAEPTTAGAIVAVLAAGDIVTITGEDIAADGYTWLPITLADGTSGWIADQLIQHG